jgi:MFS family permease
MRGILAGAFFGAEAFIPLMLVNERALTPTLAGMTLTVSALAWTAGSWYQGRPDLRVPRPRLVQLGTTLVAVGTAGAALALWNVLPPAVAAAAWAFGGLGMGLAMTSVNVLMLELSPPAEQGANSAALQFSDVLFGVLTIALAGSIFAGMHTRPGADAAVFVLIFLLMCVLALVGAVLAPRVRPAG